MEIIKWGIQSIFKNGISETIKKIINIKRQQKFLKYYYDRNTVLKAIKIGEKIIKMFPHDLYNYQQLARAYWKNKDIDSSTNTLRRGIKASYNIEIYDIIYKIESDLSNGKSISKKFTFRGGHQNYGLIEHSYENKTLLTKILPLKQSSGEFFIRELQQEYRSFKNITPIILNIRTVKDLCFITMEKIEGNVPRNININFFQKVYEINNSISSISYNNLPKMHREQTFNQNHAPLNKHELFKTLYFVNRNSEYVFSLISQFLIDNNYPLILLKLIDYLNKTIVCNNYYKYINQENHYTLQHGDFFPDNMLFNEQSGDLKIIDWGGIIIGPKWVDIAVFLGVTKQPFYDVLQNFLEHKRCNYELIEKLFFVYTLIVTWVVIFNKEENESCYQSFCSPALKYFETLLLEFEKEKAIRLNKEYKRSKMI